ncbi:MAG: hypothetical protein WCH76_05840 [Candidatus Riflemargulisbacteria bacterium]
MTTAAEDNFNHRKDDRDKDKFSENITTGVELQIMLGEIIKGHIRQLADRFKYKPICLKVSNDKKIYDEKDGEYIDTLDGSLIAYQQGVEVFSRKIELKTKELNSAFFTLKAHDVRKCVKQGIPIVMANRMMINSNPNAHLPMKVLTPEWLARLLETIEPWQIPFFGNKEGWKFHEASWEWMSASEQDTNVLFEFYGDFMGELLKGWSGKPMRFDLKRYGDKIRRSYE